MSYLYPFRNTDERSKLLVWAKGTSVAGYDPVKFRQDICGNWMIYAEHGNTLSPYGWEIDHIYPAARGGGNDLTNLQPLYWRNNRAKGDTVGWSCKMRLAG